MPWLNHLRWTFRKARAVPRLRSSQWRALLDAWRLLREVRRQLRHRPFAEARAWLLSQASASASASAGKEPLALSSSITRRGRRVHFRPSSPLSRPVSHLSFRISHCPSNPSDPRLLSVRQTLWAVDRASWFVPGKCTCLHRALAARILLSRSGHPSRLHIGGRLDPSKGFEAHAWLEIDGRVVLGALPDLDTYREFEGQIV